MEKIYEIYEMLRTYKDSTLIYSYTKKGRREWQHIQTLSELIEAKALDIEKAEEADEMSETQKYWALEAAWQALYREYEINSQNYVEEVANSAEFKRYIAENGYAY